MNRFRRCGVVLMALVVVFALAHSAGADQWVELTPSNKPTARAAHSLVTVDGVPLLFGGVSAIYYDDLWKWDDAAGNWVKLTPSGSKPKARAGHGAAVVQRQRSDGTVGDVMLIFLGQTTQNQLLQDVWAYDPTSNAWTEELTAARIPFPTGRRDFATATRGDQIYVIGGIRVSSTLDELWIYDAAAKSWRQGASLPEPRFSASAFGVEDAVIVFGGGQLQGAPTRTVVQTILRYNPFLNEWGSYKPNGSAPIAVAAAAYTIVLRYYVLLAWIVGGFDLNSMYHDETYQLDFSAERSGPAGGLGSSNRRADLPISISGGAASGLGGATRRTSSGMVELILFGGAVSGGGLSNRTFRYVSDVDADLTQKLWIGASANVAGLGGTQWKTDLEIVNRSNEAATGTIELLETAKSNTAPRSTTVTVPARQALRLSNVLQSQFAFTGSGALRLAFSSGGVLVTSRTFNDSSNGTFGQFIPGWNDNEAIAIGTKARLIQLSRSADAAVGFRTNIGFVNATDAELVLTVELRGADGATLGTVNYTLAPYEHRQVTDIFGKVTSGDVADGYALVSTTTDGGRFFTYASVVDNRTGDPIFIAP